MRVFAIARIATYAALLVFAAGFCFGIVRIFWLMPRLGPVGAVCVELPLMIAISALVWKRLLGNRDEAHDPGFAIPVGAIAFCLLIALEYALSALAFGASPATFIASTATPAGLIGLAGQLLFGLMPSLATGFRR